MKETLNSLFQKKAQQVKKLIFTQGRLIERVFYIHFFEDGDLSKCTKALKAYQNSLRKINLARSPQTWLNTVILNAFLKCREKQKRNLKKNKRF